MRKYIAAALAFVIATAASAQSTDLKGLKIGMTAKEVVQLFPEAGQLGQSVGMVETTIAGTGPYKIYLSFKDGALENILVFVPQEASKKVQAALKAKYPDLKCNSTGCWYGDLGFRNDVSPSVLSISRNPISGAPAGQPPGDI